MHLAMALANGGGTELPNCRYMSPGEQDSGNSKLSGNP